MNIREVEQLTGLKKANIRYYEEEGLIKPQRNEQNNYREYSPADVEILEKIKSFGHWACPFMISENFSGVRLRSRHLWKSGQKNSTRK